MDFRQSHLPNSDHAMAPNASRHSRRAEQAGARRQKRLEHRRIEQAWKHGRLSLSDCDFARRYLRGEVELTPAPGRERT